jgi:hypothetical protein
MIDLYFVGMKSTDLAYAAGVIDSDGCITITRGKSIGKRLFSPKVFVRQVHPEAVESLHAWFGGYTWKVPPSLPGGRPLKEWHITHNGAVAVVRAIIPFLRIKKTQANLVLKFHKAITDRSLRQPARWFIWQPREPVLSASELAKLAGVYPSRIRQSIRHGSLPSRTIKGVVFVPTRAAAEYIKNKKRTPPAEYEAMKEAICREVQLLNGPTRGISASDRASGLAYSDIVSENGAICGTVIK